MNRDSPASGSMRGAGVHRVLLVEDDADTRQNLRDILELSDCQITEAATLASALAREDLRETETIILDRKLPDGIAEQAIPKFRQLAPDAAVIVVTGNHDLNLALDCIRLGAADFILKPVDADVLRFRLEQIRERQAVSREARTLARMVEESPNATLRVDRGDRIVYANRASQALLEAWHCAVGQRLPDGVRDLFHQFTAGGARYASELAFGNRVFLMNVSPAPESNLINIYAPEVTELREAERRLLQSERLAAIGQMMAGLAHESRNALQRSQACLEMLAFEVTDRPELLDLVGRIQSAHDHLQHLYEEVRGYAAPINLQRESHSLVDVWRETWSQIAPTLNGKQIHLREFITARDPRCQIDAFAIGQVFRNIFENANAVSPSEAEIAVSCSPTELKGKSALRVAVRDHGPGLNAEQKLKIFEPFFTTKTHGTGLGMAIARRIVEAHGGAILVGDSSPSGAEIVVTLPRECP